MIDDKPTTYDKYTIGAKTYVKDTDLGDKAWRSINAGAPGKFVDILEAKFSDLFQNPKIDTNK